MGHFFGQRSKDCLDTCHVDLQLIAYVSINKCVVDFGIHEGHRSEDKQLEYFLNGKSKIDPRIPESKKRGKHLSTPSMAFDFHIAESYKGKKLTWDKTHLTYVAAYMTAVADMLYEEGKIDHRLRWGNDWDKDGILTYDHTLQDFPHVELYKP